MNAPAPPLALALAFLVFLSACGNSSRRRPEIVEFFPPPGAELDNVIEAVRVTYDMPVTILNRLDTGASGILGLIGVIAEDEPDDPRSIIIRPTPPGTFLPGPLSVRIGAGLVVSFDGQYRLESTTLSVLLGEGPNLFVASGGLRAVAEIDPDTFVSLGETPTPGARLPIGVAASQVVDVVRVWTQLEDGDGAGRAVAAYEPGDLAMTEIPLTVSPGGDLVTPSPAIDVTRDGQWVMAAFRDTALQRVRLARIDVRTGMEEGSLVLSPAASATTAPYGLRRAALGNSVLVTVATDDGTRLVQVLADQLEEVDLGPDDGVDGLVLPEGPGQIATWGTAAYVSNAFQTTADVTAAQLATGNLTEDPSPIPGSPRDILITVDGAWVVQGIANYENDEAIALRRRSLLGTADPLVVSDDTAAGNPPATSLRALVPYRTQLRFVGLLDNDVLVTFRWTDLEVEQEDLDDVTDGIQGVDISTIAPDPLGAAFATGSFPP